ncbi:MAG: zf-HC2 domain-containing protein [Desulfotignum sp.]|nr:zf-HC2 domain-containing protein [Desulfotignum sp.]MCF8136221.1 zf-HC2 domain-containing protein [Desulfotignum sp.]
MEIRCPNDEMLADYFEGRLSDEDRIKMEAHLSVCQTCLETVVAVNGVVRGKSRLHLDAAPKELTEAAVRLINRQAEKSRKPGIPMRKRSDMGMSPYKMMKNLCSSISEFCSRPWAEWRFAPIRGSVQTISKDLVTVRKQFVGIETEIKIEKTGHNKACIRVESPEYDRPQKTLRVTLKRDEREIASYLLNEGYALFEDIPFGHYNFVFVKDGAKIGTYFFEIRETCHDG